MSSPGEGRAGKGKRGRMMDRLSSQWPVRSRQGRVILEELRRTTSHPRGDELYAIVRSRLPRVSLATVYRNLERLREAGAALPIYCGDFTRYDGNVAPHDHFLCRSCRRVWDFTAGCGEERPPVAKGDGGFQVDGSYTIFYGLCPQCKG